MSAKNDGLSGWLIRQAARRAPAPLSERLKEEWSADLESRASALSQLRFALGCCWATQVIALDHKPLAMQAAATAGAGSDFYRRENVGFVSRRASSFLVVALLHVLAIYAFMLSYSHLHAKPPITDIINTLVPQVEKPVIHPAVDVPPLRAKITVRTLDEPRIKIEQTPAQETVTTTSGEILPQMGGDAQGVPRIPTRVVGGPGVGFPNVDDYYPSVEIFRNHQGVSTVRVCVDSKGRLTAEPTTVESSGSAGLDEGALKLAKAGSGHYRPSTEDGTAVSSCYPYRIRFQLKR